jgi:PAS domain S-box-containing protein
MASPARGARSRAGHAHETKQHLAAIVDNSDDAIVSIDLHGKILSWNAAATRMYGYTPEEAVGQPIDIVIPHDDERRAEELTIRASIARGGRIDHYETIRRHKSGELIEVSLSISPVTDAAGRIVAAAGFARDISERRLFRANQHLAAIVDNSDDAIVSKDLAGTILTWNDAATRRYGYTAEEAVGQPIDIVIPDDRRAEELTIRASIARGERIKRYETIRRHKGGALIDVSLSISPIHDASGRVVAAAGIARDISDLNRAYQTSEHLAAIVDNSDDAIVSKNLAGTILTWNEAATHMYGYTAEEAVGQPIDMVIPDDLRAEELTIRDKIAHGERINHYETTRRHKSGALIDVSLSISPIRDAGGRVVAAAGIARDISDLNRAYQTSEHLAAIVDNSDDAIVSKDLNGKILTWNDAATRIYGYTAEEAVGQPIDIVIPDDLRSEELSIRDKIAHGQRIDHYETIRRHKSGALIEVSLSISPVRDPTGRIAGAAGFARDISERKLFLAKERLAAIVDNSDDAIVSRDLDGIILTWNDAATRMYGYTAEEAVGQPIDIVLLGDDQRRAEELSIRASIARGERIDHAETIRRHKTGSLIEVSLSISPVRDATGRIVGAAGIARDISERKRLEDERRRATGLLERFIDYTAHDFKTPMQNILMNAQEVSRLVSAAEGSRVRELLQRIVANSFWMNKRTEGLLRTSTLQGNRQIRFTVRADKAFDESYAILKSVDQFVNSAKVTRGDLPAVASDEALLGFLFQNLLQNACKYGRIGETVVVSVSADRYPGGWKFAVRDNGMGIKPDLMERIFEPYVRDPEMDVPGTGIGLSFCRRIVEWHGGRIWAESQLGQGATFWFTIPDFSGEKYE